MIKSPLRYPGGKSRAIQQLKYLIPSGIQEYREPFVGGGSFFIYIRQTYPTLKIWINDLNPELYCFWKACQADSHALARVIRSTKTQTSNGQDLFNQLLAIDTQNLSEQQRGARFFILNRITFSGVVESGGYSQQAFAARFTESAIQRVAELGKYLQGIEITNLNYPHTLLTGGSEVFTFLDPPYYKATKSRLYGKNGILHTNFNHQEFAQQMQTCPHNWLITYDDCPEIRQNFTFANLYTWQLQYGMNNYKQGKAEKGSELFISNYPLPIQTTPCPQPAQLQLL